MGGLISRRLLLGTIPGFIFCKDLFSYVPAQDFLVSFKLELEKSIEAETFYSQYHPRFFDISKAICLERECLSHGLLIGKKEAFLEGTDYRVFHFKSYSAYLEWRKGMDLVKLPVPGLPSGIEYAEAPGVDFLPHLPWARSV